jgi:Tfp pilus assembly major pilin PilA
VGKIRKNETGFSVVEVVLVLVIVCLISAVGWLVYKNHNKTNNSTVTANATKANTSAQTKNSQAPATKTYSDQSKTFTVQYPASWTTGELKPGNAAYSVNADLLDAMEMDFIPSNAPSVNSKSPSPNLVRVIAFKSNDAQAILSAYVTGDGNTSPQNLTVNGYKAMYQQSGSASSLTYTDDAYAVTNNGVTVLFDFREKQGSDAYGASAFDATSTVPDYTDLVKSIKFTN